MPFKLFEFLEQFMIGTFFDKLTQFEKTVSTVNFLLGNLKIKFLFRN